ncbi:hypothetical protein Enr13x_72120 [Stieleria neptunia]|uniref:Uncharacterized protein n=1 Tax=Stieleria neptunia TaxID=2527979 RepID=A0A518I2G7_9BACT|nr:hypothetical protein Enr13x_72120 [Stieleria neptunia]
MEFAADLIAKATSLGLAPDDFRLVDAQSVPTLVHDCNHAFPDIPLFLWWPHPKRETGEPPSESFTSHQFIDQLGYQRIPELVSDQTERIWMFAENWGMVDRRGYDALVAFHTTPRHAHDVIGESHGFEYILVSQTLDWLIAENDHRYLIVSGCSVVDRLREITT